MNAKNAKSTSELIITFHVNNHYLELSNWKCLLKNALILIPTHDIVTELTPEYVFESPSDQLRAKDITKQIGIIIYIIANSGPG